jgi:hypothetical protein
LLEAKAQSSADLSIDGALRLLASPASGEKSGAASRGTRPARRAYRLHPFLEAVIPMMSPADLQSLADDIAAHGQRRPIVAWGDWIIDGRCRLYACALAGVEPLIEHRDFTGDDEAQRYVVSVNLMRAHRSLDQRAVSTARIERANPPAAAGTTTGE